MAAADAKGGLLVEAVAAVLTTIVAANCVHVVVLALAYRIFWVVGQAILALPAARLGANLLLSHDNGAELKLDKRWCSL